MGMDLEHFSVISIQIYKFSPGLARAITVNPRAINPNLTSFKCDFYVLISPCLLHIRHRYLRHRYLRHCYLRHRYLRRRYLRHRYLRHRYLRRGYLRRRYLRHRYLRHRYLRRRYLRRCYLRRCYLRRRYLRHRYLRRRYLRHLLYIFNVAKPVIVFSDKRLDFAEIMIILIIVGEGNFYY